MKRIIYMLCVAAMAVSCFGDGPSTKRSYYLDVDFEYGGNIFQTDSVRFDNTEGIGVGYSDLHFYHKLDPAKKDVVGGWAVSGLRGSGKALGRNEYRVNSGAGLNGSPTYTVFKYNDNPGNMPEHAVYFVNRDYGTCTMLGCYVNNTAQVVDSIKANFTEGDRLILKAIGYLNGAKTGEAKFTLAEYTGQKDSIVVNWTPFDLDKLGEVEYVDFEVTSTAKNVPTSFCMDDMVAFIALEY